MSVNGFLISDTIACLKQGADLVCHCGVEQYTRKIPQCFNSSIGGHIRHVIDHFHCFFKGIENGGSGGIDYDARQRSVRVETDPGDAVTRIEEICAMLAQLDSGDDLQITVKMDTGSNTPDLRTTSTLQRELQFLLSHTVHHYALIAVIAGITGLQVPAGFGLAPSTRRYREQSAT